MALNSFRLFLGQVHTAPEQLKVRVLHIVFDIVMVHEEELLSNTVVGVSMMPVASQGPLLTFLVNKG